jgi:predicted nucleic acid-binding protein
MKTPDAIQLATALYGRATAFLTNDAEMALIPGLHLIVLDAVLKS